MAKNKYHQDVFKPKNPTKYVGTLPIVYRSAWELTFMNVCDQHPAILQWASESLSIAYTHPMDGKTHKYIPDFLILYKDKDGKKHGEIVEIKPASQALTERATSKRDKEALKINEAKWAAARTFCQSKGLTFRVMTEFDLYKRGKTK